MLKVSSSQCSLARSCWQKYKFHYMDGLRPKKRSSSLSLGLVLHKCFDMHYQGSDTKKIMQYISTTFDDEMSKASLPDQEDILLNKYTAIGMWLYYPNKNLNFQEIESEKEFETRLGNLRGVRFVGRVDGDVKQNNTWWVRDVKVTGLGLRQFEGRASISYQASAYIYGLAKVTGKKIQGVFFDVIKRPLLKKRVDETGEDFGRRIMDDYGDAKKQKMYYTRHYTYRSPRNIQNFLDDTIKVTREIRTRRRTNDWYRNTDACWSYNTECPYRRICFAAKPDEQVVDMFYTRKEVI